MEMKGPTCLNEIPIKNTAMTNRFQCQGNFSIVQQDKNHVDYSFRDKKQVDQLEILVETVQFICNTLMTSTWTSIID